MEVAAPVGGLTHEITDLERRTMGNLGGFFGPYVFGLIKDATGGSFTFGLIALAMGPIMSGTIVLALGHDRRLEHIPAAQRVGRG